MGLCHQITACYAMVGRALASELDIEVPSAFVSTHSSPGINDARMMVAWQAMEKVKIIAAGLNHFTWMLDLRDAATGCDLYPLFHERWQQQDPSFEPLTRRVYDAFGLFPIPGDEHLCEYLPWVSDPLTRPWEKSELGLYEWDRRSRLRDERRARMAQLAHGASDIDHLRGVFSEGAAERSLSPVSASILPSTATAMSPSNAFSWILSSVTLMSRDRSWMTIWLPIGIIFQPSGDDSSPKKKPQA